MCADIINLRQVKKSRARIEKVQQAEQNRLHFGRSKAEKNLTHTRNTMERDKLDAHQRVIAPADAEKKD